MVFYAIKKLIASYDLFFNIDIFIQIIYDEKYFFFWIINDRKIWIKIFIWVFFSTINSILNFSSRIIRLTWCKIRSNILNFRNQTFSLRDYLNWIYRNQTVFLHSSFKTFKWSHLILMKFSLQFSWIINLKDIWWMLLRWIMISIFKNSDWLLFFLREWKLNAISYISEFCALFCELWLISLLFCCTNQC